MSCLHRDVKGDNFLMEFSGVEHTEQRLVLSDFGTAREVRQGERMRQKCGTRNYWSPEFYRMDYGAKVDCWAVGVVMFGLVSGKFPFKGEHDVKCKSLLIPKRCPDLGRDLIHSLLDRDEHTRTDCAAALQHPFLSERQAEETLQVTPSTSDKIHNNKGHDARGFQVEKKAAHPHGLKFENW